MLHQENRTLVDSLKSLILILAFVLGSLSARADFIRAVPPLEKAGLPLSNVLLSSPKLGLYYGSCSSVVISDEGHMLTAGHCVTDCIPQLGTDLVFTGIDEFGVIPDRLRTCSFFKVNGVPTTFKVLVARVCSKKPGVPCEGDYAILEPARQYQSESCLQIASSQPTLGEPVTSIGFPVAAKRGKVSDGNSSDGKHQYVSQGQVVNNDSCPLTLTGTDPTGAKTTMEFSQDLVNTKIRFPNFMQLSVDAVPRSSGGPIVNKSGHLVGIATETGNYAWKVSECKGSTFGLSMAKILDDLKKIKPDLLNFVFRCEKNSATQQIPSL